ncbi:hypothetical protein RRG08_003992 [Elysia crispata]|uniref:Uncharacterized protein n=1 Tax=Elysia crispata TaxID=231223 RepID=A0AAE0Y5D0_9GAST|nr:hypothetical protein RRG08_003992 [Elysia crispata]
MGEWPDLKATPAGRQQVIRFDTRVHQLVSQSSVCTGHCTVDEGVVLGRGEEGRDQMWESQTLRWWCAVGSSKKQKRYPG